MLSPLAIYIVGWIFTTTVVSRVGGDSPAAVGSIWPLSLPLILLIGAGHVVGDAIKGAWLSEGASAPDSVVMRPGKPEK